MNLFGQALGFLVDGDHWVVQRNGANIPIRLLETLGASAFTMLLITLIALPLGILIGHTGRGRIVGIVSSNIARAIPTLGLFALLLLLLPGTLGPVTIVLVVLGIPPMLAGVYSGIDGVDKRTVDAARAVGMTELQIITRVELPLAAPLIVGGLRATALQVVSTVTVAATFAQFGVGYYIVQGTSSAIYPEMIAGAVLIIVLVLLVDALLTVAQRAVVPAGSPAPPRTDRSRRTPAVRTPTQEGNHA